MTELTGISAGFRAAEEDQRKTVMGALQAQEALGNLAMQPARQQLLQAQADTATAQVQDQQKMADIARIVAAKRAQGVDATTNDLTVAGRPKSLADPYIQMFEEAARQGVSPLITEKLAATASQIQQREASAASAQTTQQLNQLKQVRERLEMRGSFAAAALEAGPAQWAQMRQAAVDRSPPGQESELAKLPQDWQAAQPMLKAALTESLQGKDFLTMKERELQDGAQRARWGSANAKATADVEYMKKKGVFLEAKQAHLGKNGGTDSPEVQRAREEMTLSRRALREARDRKEFPLAPLDPAARELNKTYTAANGVRFLWAINPATGKGAAVQLAPAAGTKAGAAEPTVRQPPEGSYSEDTSEDGEE